MLARQPSHSPGGGGGRSAADPPGGHQLHHAPMTRTRGGGGSGCSTRVWLERSLFVGIGGLAVMGILYGSRVERAVHHHNMQQQQPGGGMNENNQLGRWIRTTIDDGQSSLLSLAGVLREQREAGTADRQQLQRQRRATGDMSPRREERTSPWTAWFGGRTGNHQESQRQQRKQKEVISIRQQGKREERKEQAQKEVISNQEQDRKQQPERQEQRREEELAGAAPDLSLLRAGSAKNATDRLNIVLFYADDWTQKVLGKLNPDVHTPNIDRMADNGMIFTNNCVTTSVCWMSRATLMTGVYSSRHRQADPSLSEMFTTNPWSETLFPLLKSAGYHTGIVGKWHAPQPEQEMKQAFDKYTCYYGDHWMDWFGGKMRHITDLNREHALEVLKNRPRDQNFALKVSFFATHAWDGHYPSYEPMNGTRSRHYPDNVTIPTPKTATEQAFKDLPPFFTEANEGRNRWRRRFEPDYYQDNIKDLYSMATEVDWAIGEIIEELKAQGVYENTVLIFTTDNGNLHG
jgi:Sulfatase